MSEFQRIASAPELAPVRAAGLGRIYPDRIKIAVSMATCGLATGAGKVYQALRSAIQARGADVLLSSTGCLGFCQVEPVVSVYRPGRGKIIYQKIKPAMAEELLGLLLEGQDKKQWALCRFDEEELIASGEVRKLAGAAETGEAAAIPLYGAVPFFKKQRKIVLRNCGFIDPGEIEEYIGRGGYGALLQALSSLKPEEVIAQVKLSGLRGRGGAGFPTGLKWDFCRQAPGGEKYVICNADEGDPGAYMDRSVLEGDPHSVLEGMLIGAYAIGACEGVIYCRTEYPQAIEKLNRAIGQAEALGLLGDGIGGSGFNFRIRVVEGSGAFVCGEETSLINSIEGRPAEPRNRPPFPAQAGLWGKPTNINNVETWANIPVILSRGGAWYAGIGTEKSKGTKVFSLVGKVRNTGLVEVPMGLSLKEIVEEIGGGIPRKKKLKAVQTGGPSGGCIPAALVDMPVDYERLAEAGSIMGSGGMVVMDEDTCMVDIARFFTSFTVDESCGKCTSCRDGLDSALTILERITAGGGTPEDLVLLEELAPAIRDASQCGLGKTAPNAVLSTFQHFRAEYEAHVHDHKCVAGVCKPLFAYTIDEAACVGCGKCKDCPEACIEGEKKAPHRILDGRCVKCGLCYDVCPTGAVRKV